MRARSFERVPLSAVAALAACGVLAVAGAAARAQSGLQPLAHDVPAAALAGHDLGPHNANAVLRLNVGLEVPGSDALDQIIRDASDPASPSYGKYLSRDEYLAEYAPSPADTKGLEDWLSGRGLTVTGVSPERLYVTVKGTVQQIDHAFAVAINDYRVNGSVAFSNDRPPTVPAQLHVRWISGMNDMSLPHVDPPGPVTVAPDPSPPAQAAPSSGPRAEATVPKCGGATCLYPSNFRKAYKIPSGWSATGQTIGMTLWGAPLKQGDLNAFTSTTKAAAITIGKTGADGVKFIPVDGSSTDTSTWGETAMDVEDGHGVAPGSHIKYWLAVDNTDPSLEDALSAAADDPQTYVVSNSWGNDADSVDWNMDSIFQFGAAVGMTFYFSTGDHGVEDYPASDPYVVAVGGTSLQLDSASNWSSESAWQHAGSGCNDSFDTPTWQYGVSPAFACDGRATPDIAADADPDVSGAYVYYNHGWVVDGGTSLATPLWAGFTADWNRARVSAHQGMLGFAAPLFYYIGSRPNKYAAGFHDVTDGWAGENFAGDGWDGATGWGTPNFAGLSLSGADSTITFGEFADGSYITNEYLRQGVRFGGDEPYITDDAANPSSPVLSGSPLFQGKIRASFVKPGTTTPTTVSSFTLDVGYINNPGSTEITYYNAKGKVLGNHVINTTGITTVTIKAAGVASFLVHTISGEDAGFAIDNVSFSLN